MIRDEGLTSGQKACLGALMPALLFLPVVVLLAMFRSNVAVNELLGAGLEQPIVQLFWALVLVSVVALFGFFLATLRRNRFYARRRQISQNTF